LATNPFRRGPVRRCRCSINVDDDEVDSWLQVTTNALGTRLAVFNVVCIPINTVPRYPITIYSSAGAGAAAAAAAPAGAEACSAMRLMFAGELVCGVTPGQSELPQQHLRSYRPKARR
jgi:hypothetical protein